MDNLIDRESELQILTRLRRKNIGPRLLGCFSNGRFEEFFHAETLNPHDLRDPAISVQIAKRMRELHEGIDLLPLERADGPFVWQNIFKWLKQCQQIVTWLDTQTQEHHGEGLDRPPFVCGTTWSVFLTTLNKYHDWLFNQYGGTEKVKQGMVFAHNDVSRLSEQVCAQLLTRIDTIWKYSPHDARGRIASLNPSKPAQTVTSHRFRVCQRQYARAGICQSLCALCFHVSGKLSTNKSQSEWCYNYHDEKASFACNTKLYPNLEEQRRFLHAYITHKPKFSSSSSTAGSASGQPSTPGTPSLAPTTSSLSTSLISNFMLDSRNPQSSHANPDNLVEEVEREIENEITRLQHESRIWRLANSAQWVMWGVLRAKIPHIPDFDDPTQSAAVAAGPHASQSTLNLAKMASPISEEDGSDPLDEEEKKLVEHLKDRRPDPLEEGEEEDTEEFDYLAYTWERAMFFWGDAVGLALVQKEDLPEEVQKNLKLVDY